MEQFCSVSVESFSASGRPTIEVRFQVCLCQAKRLLSTHGFSERCPECGSLLLVLRVIAKPDEAGHNSQNFASTLLRNLSIGLLASVVVIAPLPLQAEGGSADDLGVMSISLKDVVRPRLGLQGALQGAGTPNEAGVGVFLPINVGNKSVVFLDFLANANFGDFNKYIDKPADYTSSIINTTVSGTTVSTSTRLGYRVLNADNNWMYGINAGFDTRPMATAYADNGVDVTSSSTVFFRQGAFNIEAVSEKLYFGAYALFPNGNTEQSLNSVYDGGALLTYGANFGYAISEDIVAKVGYYYQDGDLDSADGLGVVGRLSYSVNNDLLTTLTFTYDPAFEASLSVGFVWRPLLKASSAELDKKLIFWGNEAMHTPDNRNVRVHDCCYN